MKLTGRARFWLVSGPFLARFWPACPQQPRSGGHCGPRACLLPSTQPAVVSVACLLSLIAGQEKLQSGRRSYVSRASGSGSPVTQVFPTLSSARLWQSGWRGVWLDSAWEWGLAGGWVVSQLPCLCVM